MLIYTALSEWYCIVMYHIVLFSKISRSEIFYNMVMYCCRQSIISTVLVNITDWWILQYCILLYIVVQIVPHCLWYSTVLYSIVCYSFIFFWLQLNPLPNTNKTKWVILLLPAHLVLALSGGPGAPVPPSRGLVSRTLISYSVSGSRWPILCVVLSTGCRSYMVPETVRYSTSLSMMGPSPLMLLAFSWIQR